MCLMRFFLYVKLQTCFSRFFKKREQFMDSSVALSKTKRDFLNCNKTLWTPSILPKLPSNNVCIKNRLS